jgi:CRP-like cAMP-binding protein
LDIKLKSYLEYYLSKLTQNKQNRRTAMGICCSSQKEKVHPVENADAQQEPEMSLKTDCEKVDQKASMQQDSVSSETNSDRLDSSQRKDSDIFSPISSEPLLSKPSTPETKLEENYLSKVESLPPLLANQQFRLSSLSSVTKLEENNGSDKGSTKARLADGSSSRVFDSISTASSSPKESPKPRAKAHFNADRSRKVKKALTSSQLAEIVLTNSEKSDPNQVDFLADSPYGKPVSDGNIHPNIDTEQALTLSLSSIQAGVTREEIMQHNNFAPPKAAFVLSQQSVAPGSNYGDVVNVHSFNFSSVWKSANKKGGTANNSAISNIEDIQGFHEFEQKLRKVMVPVVYLAGDYIIRQSDIGYEMFFIVSGRVEVTHHNVDGKKVSINFLGPGSFFGEMGVLFQVPRTAAIRAVENCVCEKLTKVNLDAVLVDFPDVAKKFKAVANARMKVAREAKLHQRRRSAMVTVHGKPIIIASSLLIDSNVLC